LYFYSTKNHIQFKYYGKTIYTLLAFAISFGVSAQITIENTTASGTLSTAIGYFTEASGDGSTAMGSNTQASGILSTAMGLNTTAEDYLSLAIGVHNKTDESPNPDFFSYQNTAFVIGNGGFDSEGNPVGTSDTFSNAFEVLFDGTTTIAGDLSINSDARLKANIISLGSTLAKVLQIDGKSYTMKKDENKKQKIGVLAQDIEKVFPELVSESNNIKSVNYQGLVPVLINALKEQDAKMNEQQTEIDELKEIVQALVSRE
jgi:autotransporter adhesin